MATTLANARQEVRGLYGLTYSTAEDSLFANSFLTTLINKSYYWLAGVTRCFHKRDLKAALTSGQATYELDERLIQSVANSFRYNLTVVGTTWEPLGLRLYTSVMQQYGALENVPSGPTKGYVILPSDGGHTTRTVLLVPAPLFATGTGELRYSGWVYPEALVNDDDPIQLSDPDCFRLYAASAWQLAMFERSRGRPDAPVELWQQQAGVEASEFHRIEREATREPSRTPEVRESPLASALERMRPLGMS